MDEVETPQYFLCPISLQIMKDPVTTITGITYDRDSIERWLLKVKATTDETSVACPVTKQPLPQDSELTPNHTLRRLIQCWCTLNAAHGVERIPTPKSPVSKSTISKLLRSLDSPNRPDFLDSLKRLETLACDDKNKTDNKCLSEFGVARFGTAVVNLFIRLCREEKTVGLQELLRILQSILTAYTHELKQTITSKPEIVGSITWVLISPVTAGDIALQAEAVKTMRKIAKVSGSSIIERLDADFFKGMVGFISRAGKLGNHVCATKAALNVLVDAAQWAANRSRMIADANAVHALIELELGGASQGSNDKKVTELVLCLLAQLCACADGRERLVGHGAGMALVTKRLLRVSPGVDCAAVQILGLVARFSGTAEVLSEMLKVGAVSKLCMVLQADSDKSLKDKAREVLRMHSGVWNNSPCIQIYLFTRFPSLQF